MTNVVFHPNSTSVYLVYMGDTKYPKEPAAVTIPIAIVLELKGKCFDTIETGILIAVAARPIPIKIPKSKVNQKPVLAHNLKNKFLLNKIRNL